MPETSAIVKTGAQTHVTMLADVTTSAGTFVVTSKPSDLFQSQTFTAAGATRRTNPAITKGETLRSPYEHSRVGWIHELRKEDLAQEMARFGIDVQGKVEDLRKRFSKAVLKRPEESMAFPN